ncbi:MAG: transmembrane amino acid transporter protein-domain-containing protein [Benjaminiella poitrasii]|nr:MAG: transmembrane amino acid transporter protein-domain-containing protein [Benjaminiella poitrasii]
MTENDQDLMTDNASTSFFYDTSVTQHTSVYSDVTYPVFEEDKPKDIQDYGSITSTSTTTVGSSLTVVWGASFNLVNAMMGTGIIGLPFAFQLCGFWSAVMFLIAIACLSCIMMYTTVLCGLETGTTESLVTLVERLSSYRPSGTLINLVIFLHTAGTAVSYFIVLGDTLPDLLDFISPHLASREHVILTFGFLCTLPLCLSSHSAARFAKWSALSIVLLLIMIACMTLRAITAHGQLNNDKQQPIPINNTVQTDMFKGLAIMSLSFGCAQNLFGIYNDMQCCNGSTEQQILGHNKKRWMMACAISVGIALIINLLFAITAYLCIKKIGHGEETVILANVFLNFSKEDPIICIVKLALGLFMILTIPLCILPCKESVVKMLGMKMHTLTDRQHDLITTAVFLVILYFGITVKSLGRVFDFIGGISTTLLGFLLPGLAYFYLFSSDLLFNKSDTSKSWMLLVISLVSVCISFPIIYYSLL